MKKEASPAWNVARAVLPADPVVVTRRKTVSRPPRVQSTRATFTIAYAGDHIDVPYEPQSTVESTLTLFCCLHAIDPETVRPLDLTGEPVPYDLPLELLEPKQLFLGLCCKWLLFTLLANLSGEPHRAVSHRPSLANSLIAHPPVKTREITADGDPLELIKEIKQQQMNLLSVHEDKARIRSLTMQKQRNRYKPLSDITDDIQHTDRYVM